VVGVVGAVALGAAGADGLLQGQAREKVGRGAALRMVAGWCCVVLALALRRAGGAFLVPALTALA